MNVKLKYSKVVHAIKEGGSATWGETDCIYNWRLDRHKCHRSDILTNTPITCKRCLKIMQMEKEGSNANQNTQDR